MPDTKEFLKPLKIIDYLIDGVFFIASWLIAYVFIFGFIYIIIKPTFLTILIAIIVVLNWGIFHLFRNKYLEFHEEASDEKVELVKEIIYFFYSCCVLFFIYIFLRSFGVGMGIQNEIIALLEDLYMNFLDLFFNMAVVFILPFMVFYYVFVETLFKKGVFKKIKQSKSEKSSMDSGMKYFVIVSIAYFLILVFTLVSDLFYSDILNNFFSGNIDNLSPYFVGSPIIYYVYVSLFGSGFVDSSAKRIVEFIKKDFNF